MSHTDKFGRTWYWTPDHDTDMMVQVPWQYMAKCSDAERIISNGPTYDDNKFTYLREWGKWDVPPDCYILKGGRTLHTGARYGHEGSHYLSSLIHHRGTLDMMLWALHLCPGSMENFIALEELFPNLKAPEGVY